MLRLSNRLQAPAFKHALRRRNFHVKAIHSIFPASLIYYCPKHDVELFDHKENETRIHDPYDDGVVMANDGLVYPGIDKHSVSNGVVMLPNTFIMQECVRRYVDEFLDRAEDEEVIETPRIYTVPKGTSIPGNLILVNEHSSRFSLQPSFGTSLQGLNRSLGHFFQQFAVKELAEDWLENHPYEAAMSDEVEKVWSSK